jgi:hypothetical protein
MVDGAERLGVDRNWPCRKSRQVPFTRLFGHRTLLFDAAVLDR